MLFNLLCQKVLVLACGICSGVFLSCYMVLFNHAAPKEVVIAPNLDIMAASNVSGKPLGENERRTIDATRYWTDFITENNFTAIGEIYDNCDEKDRMMVGRTILLPNVRWGGIKGLKSRTFINTSLDSELTGGKFHLEVKYNGKDLYSNKWELCTLDEDYGDDRLIYCPFIPGEYSFVKDRQIPIYLPKGRYETKGWMADQEDQIILCGVSDFSL